MTALVWFRRDLRVHDHPPLRAALDAHERVVPVFVLDDRLLRASPNRAHFLLESLRELREALRERGGELVVRRGAPERELPALARETGATAAYYAADASPYATARDARVDAALRSAGVEPRRTPGTFIAAVDRPYVVFTPFWRAWREAPRRPVRGAPRSVPAPAGLIPGDIPHAAPEASDPLPPGERAGRARMDAWLRGGLHAYAERRDRLAGGTSMLSP